jgi:hypothetical protein
MRSDCFEYSKIVALMPRFFIGKIGAKIFAKHPLALFNVTKPQDIKYMHIWVFENYILILRPIEIVFCPTLSCV